VDGLWATKSEGVGLIVRAISFQDFQPMCHDPPMSQTDGRTDGRTTCNLNTATTVHRTLPVSCNQEHYSESTMNKETSVQTRPGRRCSQCLSCQHEDVVCNVVVVE